MSILFASCPSALIKQFVFLEQAKAVGVFRLNIVKMTLINFRQFYVSFTRHSLKIDSMTSQRNFHRPFSLKFCASHLRTTSVKTVQFLYLNTILQKPIKLFCVTATFSNSQQSENPKTNEVQTKTKSEKILNDNDSSTKAAQVPIKETVVKGCYI